METAEKRYLKNMPRRPGAPPFWTLTPLRLWLVAVAGGLLVAWLAWWKLPIHDWQGGAGFIFFMATILIAWHINHVWAHIMDYHPDEIDTIPKTRALFALRRLPAAVIMSTVPYWGVALLWFLGTHSAWGKDLGHFLQDWARNSQR